MLTILMPWELEGTTIKYMIHTNAIIISKEVRTFTIFDVFIKKKCDFVKIGWWCLDIFVL